MIKRNAINKLMETIFGNAVNWYSCVYVAVHKQFVSKHKRDIVAWLQNIDCSSLDRIFPADRVGRPRVFTYRIEEWNENPS